MLFYAHTYTYTHTYTYADRIQFFLAICLASISYIISSTVVDAFGPRLSSSFYTAMFSVGT